MEEQIDSYLNTFQEEMEILGSIPGIGRLTASIFIAGVGSDMDQFPTAGYLTS
ncbi:transposase [Streptococcus thoraltensis]|uniref:transposase n=1 Tax=Streptococcus thoraltensis TaxID=55085 RepID=UPI0003A7D51C|nr:transposase [Streptococcus thoraltensis]MDY4761188.1 transposase [Streptococcus thoraltensis]